MRHPVLSTLIANAHVSPDPSFYIIAIEADTTWASSKRNAFDAPQVKNLKLGTGIGNYGPCNLAMTL